MPVGALFEAVLEIEAGRSKPRPYKGYEGLREYLRRGPSRLA